MNQRLRKLTFRTVVVIALASHFCHVWSMAQIAGSANQWRRTAHGWEKCQSWPHADDRQFDGIRAVHPLTLAILELMIAVGVLYALAGRDEPSGPSTTARPTARLS